MRITEAARRLGTSPRMLRYRELLGLLPVVREHRSRRAGAAHRRFSDDDLATVALELRLERRYDISPAALAFGLRVLADPGVRAEVAELGRRIGRISPPPARALDFEKQRALRLLSLPQSARAPRHEPRAQSPRPARPGGAEPGRSGAVPAGPEPVARTDGSASSARDARNRSGSR